MLSLLSSGAMILADRLFLARLSISALNAVSEAEMFFLAIQFSFVALTSYAEVLVGKAFGASNDEKVGRSVWTMIWLSFASFGIFALLSYFGTNLLFSDCPNKELAETYFHTLVFFGPLFPLNAALSSFWIGRGKTGFATYLVACTSILNIVIDPLLIFGTPFSQPLGVQGAALATGISQLLLSIALFSAFLSKENRKLFQTNNWRFDFGSCKEAIIHGSPQAFFMLAQYAAWALFFRIMNLASAEHGLVCSISQALYYFFSFAIEGVSKATSSVVSNLIGAMRHKEVRRVAWAAMRILLIFSTILAALLLLASDIVLTLFIPKEMASSSDLWIILRISLVWIWLSLVGEAFLYLWSSILVALGDSRFISLMNSLAVWLLGVLPAYIVALKLKLPPHVAIAVISIYYVVSGVLFFYRMRSRIMLHHEYHPSSSTQIPVSS
jgi:MATE family multidrug resistance protein